MLFKFSGLIEEWRSGTPSLCEWNGIWSARNKPSRVGSKEFGRIIVALRIHLTETGLTEGFAESCDIFVVDHLLIDRSLYVELENLSYFNMEFLEELRRWLWKNFRTWRIILPTGSRDSTCMVIYATAIRVGYIGANRTADWVKRRHRTLRGKKARNKPFMW